MNIAGKKILYPLLIFVVILVVYLPLASFQFSLKNDAFTDNFPTKYFFSAALHEGTFPLWNPYSNFGFPIYADYGFAYYNPITWLFGLLGYNAYTFTVEVLLYLYIAGLSMFLLSGNLLNDKKIAFLCASMYMCSGFFLGNLQHVNFITGAAFIPLVVYSFLSLLRFPAYGNGIKFTLSLYMVIACGHPAIPIGTIYILLFLFIILVFFKQVSLKQVLKNNKYYLFSFLGLLLLLSPAIYAYTIMLPHYGFLNNNVATTPGAIFNTKSFLSLLLPVVVHSKDYDWGNDISMRNIYFSVSGLSLALFALTRVDRLTASFLIISIIGLFLSFGNPIRNLLIQLLPFLNNIRTIGEYRVFFLFFIILISGFGIKQSFQSVSDLRQNKFVKFFFYTLIVVSSIIFIISTSKQNITHFLFNTSNYNISAFIKTIIDNFSIKDGFFINTFLLICLCSIFLFKKMTLLSLSLLIVADLIVFSWIALAFTGLSQKPIFYVHSSIESYPDTFPIPNDHKVINDGVISTELESYIGDESYYNKSIGTTQLTDYPSYFSKTEKALKSEEAKIFLNKPFAFKIDDTLRSTEHLFITKFKPNKIEIDFTFDKESRIGLLQNTYPFWSATLNNQTIKTSTIYSSFIQIEVPQGKGDLVVEYKDNAFLILFGFSTLLFFGLLFFLYRHISYC